ncbi:hypothetical protein [Azospirillum sp.]|uniref:hypothetical protein n=1 Tax=Azospirillum sp. TaxID=34012 RepID=UPI002603B945|nr:hypothetical protein [Azospirillum sp.]
MRFDSVSSVFLAALAVAGVLMGAASAASGPNWPDAVARLSQEREQATGCVRLIKTRGAAADQASANTTYDEARAEINATIDGLATALELDKRPDTLSDLTARLKRVEAGRAALCARANTLRLDGEKGGGWEFLGAVLEPLTDLVIEVLKHTWEREAQRRATIKSQLEGTKWPSFAAITPENR